MLHLSLLLSCQHRPRYCCHHSRAQWLQRLFLWRQQDWKKRHWQQRLFLWQQRGWQKRR